jgi:pimeloyl-ACP methyl ester carboxylesterase
MSLEDGAEPDIRRTPFEMSVGPGWLLRGDVRVPGEVPGHGSSGNAIVVCHGFKGFKDWGFFPYLARRLAAETLATVVSFNFSGSGIGPDLETFTDLEAFGHNTFTREIADLDAVLDGLLRGRLGEAVVRPTGSVGIIGHSRGAAAAILAGARRTEVKAVVTWAGIGSVFRYERWFAESLADRDVMEVLNARTGQRLPLYRDVLDDLRRNRDSLDMERASAELGPSLLIVHGSEDESVPVAEALALHEAAPQAALAIIDGASHTMDSSHPFPGPNPRLDEAVRRSAEHFELHLAEEAR